jgi:hypothetical protein
VTDVDQTEVGDQKPPAMFEVVLGGKSSRNNVARRLNRPQQAQLETVTPQPSTAKCGVATPLEFRNAAIANPPGTNDKEFPPPDHSYE